MAYYRYMELYEKLSIHFIRGLGGSADSWRQALYLTELLMKYEPTIASLEFIGDFQTHNLNYLIRKLNAIGEHFLLEDDTVAYLVRRKRKAANMNRMTPSSTSWSSCGVIMCMTGAGISADTTWPWRLPWITFSAMQWAHCPF